MKVMNPRLVRWAKRLDLVWHIFPRNNSAKNLRCDINSILIVDLHLLGDMVMLLPLLQAIRTRFPSAHVALLAGPWAEFALEGKGLINELIPYVASWVKPQNIFTGVLEYFKVTRRLRKRSWDLGVDIRGDIRQILLLFLARCRRRVGFDFTGGATLLTDLIPDDGKLRHILDHHERIAAALDAWDGENFVPRLSLTPKEKKLAETIEPFIGFHFGASLPLRRLPAREAASLILNVSQEQSRLVLFASPDLDTYNSEVLSCLPVDVAGRLEVWRGTIREFVVMASRADRIFVMDSGPAHIASAAGSQITAFFGPNLPEYTAPRGPHVQIVQDLSVTCRPCDQRHCTNVIYQACMAGLVARWTQPTNRLENTGCESKSD